MNRKSKSNSKSKNRHSGGKSNTFKERKDPIPFEEQDYEQWRDIISYNLRKRILSFDNEKFYNPLVRADMVNILLPVVKSVLSSTSRSSKDGEEEMMPVLKIEKALQNFLHTKKGRKKVAEVLISHGLQQKPMNLKEALDHIGDMTKRQDKRNNHKMNENRENTNEIAQQNQQCDESLKLELGQISQVSSSDLVNALQEGSSEKSSESFNEEIIDFESCSEGETPEERRAQLKRDEVEVENNDTETNALDLQLRDDPQTEAHSTAMSPAESTMTTSTLVTSNEDMIDKLSKIIKSTVQEALKPLRMDIQSLNTKVDNLQKRMDAQQRHIAVIQEMSIATLLSQSFPPAERSMKGMYRSRQFHRSEDKPMYDRMVRTYRPVHEQHTEKRQANYQTQVILPGLHFYTLGRSLPSDILEELLTH